MLLPKRFDLLSLLAGALAIPISALSTYMQTVRLPGGGALLRCLDQLGFVHQTNDAAPVATVVNLFPSLDKAGLASTGQVVVVSGAPELSETSVFAINDENAAVLALFVAILLAATSMTAALWSEYRRAPTLYLSAGYVCGALAVALIRPLAGFICLIAGIMVVLVLRHNREDHNA